MPGDSVIAGLHGNGSVEIVFDTSQVGPEASYDRGSGICSVSCHDHGGKRPRPSWNDARPMTCGDCHGSPPTGHFAGACSTCHHESDATGTSLVTTILHLNGTVDLGDGSGKCGACHGSGDDPSPSTAAHRTHHVPTLATPIQCSECHVAPTTLFSPGHLDGVAEITFSGRALARTAQPSWDGASCNDVACHGAGLAGVQLDHPSWADASGAAKACGACHGVPPPLQHTTSAACDRVECHGSEVERTTTSLAISADGRVMHVNGSIDVATR
jgi:predicted CxxxxCH...CXXCH cytochrome family protein